MIRGEHAVHITRRKYMCFSHQTQSLRYNFHRRLGLPACVPALESTSPAAKAAATAPSSARHRHRRREPTLRARPFAASNTPYSGRKWGERGCRRALRHLKQMSTCRHARAHTRSCHCCVFRSRKQSNQGGKQMLKVRAHTTGTLDEEA